MEGEVPDWMEVMEQDGTDNKVSAPANMKNHHYKHHIGVQKDTQEML